MMSLRSLPSRRWIRRALLGGVACGAFGVLVVMLANLHVTSRAKGRLYTLEEVEQIPAREVAIVLGARVMPDGDPSTSLADRLDAARLLYAHGKVKKILLTGDHGTRGYDELEAMFAWMLDHGVPPEVLYVDHAGFRTLDSMQRARHIFEVEEAIVCTQQFHLARSLFLGEQQGMDVLGIAADKRRYAKHQANLRREAVARTVALLDVYVLRRGPKLWGEKIPISGPPEPSYDAKIEALVRAYRKR